MDTTISLGLSYGGLVLDSTKAITFNALDTQPCDRLIIPTVLKMKVRIREVK